MIRIALIVAVALAQFGCLSGPRYAQPVIDMPDTYRGAERPQSAAERAVEDLQWFDLYQDERLRELLTEALENNYDARLAAERVLEARARFRIDRSFRFLTLDARGDVTQQEISRAAAQLPASIPREQTSGAGSLNLTWELDFWGRLRRLSQAGRAEFLAAEWAQRNVQINLIATVARAYLDLVELDRELTISQGTVETRRESLRLTQARKDRGIATALEVRQAENLVYSASTRIPQLERLIAQQENLIQFLVGTNPAAVEGRAELTDAIVAPAIPTGLPTELIDRRPNVQRAEQRLIAANARIGAAKAALLPTFSLTGTLGFRSLELDEFLDGDARTRTLTAGFLAPIFNAGRLRSVVRVSEAQQRQALIEYERSLRESLRQVSDSLIAVEKTAQQRQEQERLVAALSEANRLSRLRYEGGVDNYLQVLDAERDLFAGQLALAQIRRDELITRVDLYEALGGGWR